MRSAGPLRILVLAETSLFARGLAAALERACGLNALSGRGLLSELRGQLTRFHPDAIVLDLDLRASDALDLLENLQTHYPVPVLVTAAGDGASIRRALVAGNLGAVDLLRRPPRLDAAALDVFAAEVAGRLLGAARHWRPVLPTAGGRPTRSSALDPARYVVGIGASTGGTRALEVLLEAVPSDFPPIVIVQHLPASFTRSFAERLSANSAVAVAEAAGGEWLEPGRAFVARGDTHLVVTGSRGRFQTAAAGQNKHQGHCPSVDVLFDSLAKQVGRQGVGVLLTGMGADGAAGLLRMRQAGAVTIAQDERSCVVYGMPKAAMQNGAAQWVATPADIPALIERVLVGGAAPIPAGP
ncbi:MAG: chemotaxis response regulator protein-glutamate methylesterase [Phycisphaerales bacterium]|nr:chemotaxis response regulator protein-glutamate methylesterase [Phycisphaerales bacterium]